MQMMRFKLQRGVAVRYLVGLVSHHPIGTSGSESFRGECGAGMLVHGDGRASLSSDLERVSGEFVGRCNRHLA